MLEAFRFPTAWFARCRVGVVLVPALAALSVGCAFSDVAVPLPTQGLVQKLTAGAGQPVVVIAPFADQRAQPKRCGMQKNGWGWDTADALCQRDPSAWVAEQLATELRASGFRVLDAKAASEPAALRIEGSLLQFFIEPVIGSWVVSHEADLSVKLTVSSTSGFAATRTFYVKGWAAGMASTGSHYGVALDRASQALLHELVSAIGELFRKYPELAASSTGGLT